MFSCLNNQRIPKDRMHFVKTNPSAKYVIFHSEKLKWYENRKQDISFHKVAQAICCS